MTNLTVPALSGLRQEDALIILIKSHLQLLLQYIILRRLL